MTEAELLGAATARLPWLDFDRAYTLVRAEIEVVERHAGGLVASEIFIDPPGCVLSVIRPIDTITTIAERRTFDDAAVEVDPTDYERVDLWRVRRRTDGVNPASTWRAACRGRLRARARPGAPRPGASGSGRVGGQLPDELV